MKGKGEERREGGGRIGNSDSETLITGRGKERGEEEDGKPGGGGSIGMW